MTATVTTPAICTCGANICQRCDLCPDHPSSPCRCRLQDLTVRAQSLEMAVNTLGKRLAKKAESFRAAPSATNWNALSGAMGEYQNAWQILQEARQALREEEDRR